MNYEQFLEQMKEDLQAQFAEDLHAGACRCEDRD
jgi:hypothetical protein